jgi:hypothetical protein
MTTTEELQNMEGQTAVDMNGAKLGKIGQIYVDDQTGQPLWVTISTGMFGTKQSFAPLYGSRSDGGDLHLAVTKEMVTDAPVIEADGHIEDSENEALYTYYNGYLGGTSQDQGQVYAGETREDLAGRGGIQGQDTSGPVTDANRGAATSGSDISEEEHEVTLRAERPVVNKETVPVERVRLGTETVTEDHEVSETLRKEQIDDPDVSTTGTTR